MSGAFSDDGKISTEPLGGMGASLLDFQATNENNPKLSGVGGLSTNVEDSDKGSRRNKFNQGRISERDEEDDDENSNILLINQVECKSEHIKQTFGLT